MRVALSFSPYILLTRLFCSQYLAKITEKPEFDERKCFSSTDKSHIMDP